MKTISQIRERVIDKIISEVMVEVERQAFDISLEEEYYYGWVSVDTDSATVDVKIEVIAEVEREWGDYHTPSTVSVDKRAFIEEFGRVEIYNKDGIEMENLAELVGGALRSEINKKIVI